MSGHYGLDFMIGKTRCQLVNISQGDIIAQRERPYYYHQHLYYEFHYVEKGFCEFICQEERFLVQEGQLLMIPPQLYHSVNVQSTDAEQMSLSINIQPPKAATDAQDLQFYHTFPREGAILLSARDLDLHNELLRLWNLAQNSEANYLTREKIRALANIFLIDIYEQLAKGNELHAETDATPPLSQEYLLDEFFSSRFITNSSSKELADRLHISPRQLHRTIKKKYNMNYREKSKEIRVEIATNLLLNTKKSIAQIAETLGYSRSANFSYFIKNATGKTPSQIRKEGKLKVAEKSES